MWGLQLPILQHRGPTLAPDLPGFGSSAPLPPGQRTPEHYADWVERWLAARQVGPLVAVGYSMGGTLAVLLAQRHPRRVRGLVLCCCSPQWGRAGRYWAARVFASLGRRWAMELFQLTVRWGSARFTEPAARVELDDMLRRAHRPTMGQLYLRLAGLDLTPVLPELWVPTLVVGGDRDRLAPPSHLRALAGGVPDSTLEVFGGAGHLLCLTHSARLALSLNRFLLGPGGTGPD